MSSLVLLVTLVVAAFTISAVLGRSGHYGLIGGSEYLFVGALIGPVLGLVDAESAGMVRPMLLLCSAWMGLGLGLRLPALLRGLHATELIALVVEAVVVVAVADVGLGLLGRFGVLSLWGAAGPMPHALRLGLGLLAAPTTKATWAWARRQLGATGPTADFLERVSATDDLLPVLGLLVLTALYNGPEQPLPPLLIGGLTVGLALVGALSFTALAGRRPHEQHAWVALIGVLLLATGVSSRLGLPVLTSSALCGVLMTVLSAEPDTVREKMMGPTHRPVVLVLMMVIGTRLNLSLAVIAPLVAVVALRLAGKLGAGLLMAPLGARSTKSGLGLLGFGGVAAAIAAQMALFWPSAAKLLFAAAATHALVGDVSSALGLRLLVGKNAIPVQNAEVT